jgi:hypothetical protein
MRYTASAIIMALISVIALCRVVCAEPPTQVVMFQPAVPEGRPVDGSCWTGSIATDRPGAWRCSVGNGIYDPCFSVAAAPNLVVCQRSPFTKQEVALKLTKPLPTAQKTVCTDCVWAFELADGGTCTIAGTGTLAMIAGEPLRWTCSDPSCSGNSCPDVGVIGTLKVGRVWAAQEVTFRWSGAAAKLLGRKSVAVRKVWR